MYKRDHSSICSRKSSQNWFFRTWAEEILFRKKLSFGTVTNVKSAAKSEPKSVCVFKLELYNHF